MCVCVCVHARATNIAFGSMPLSVLKNGAAGVNAPSGVSLLARLHIGDNARGWAGPTARRWLCRRCPLATASMQLSEPGQPQAAGAPSPDCCWRSRAHTTGGPARAKNRRPLGRGEPSSDTHTTKAALRPQPRAGVQPVQMCGVKRRCAAKSLPVHRQLHPSRP